MQVVPTLLCSSWQDLTDTSRRAVHLQSFLLFMAWLYEVALLQVEGKLAAVTVQHDRLVAESEEKVKATRNTVDDLRQEKHKLLVQLEERQRSNCCCYYPTF